MRKKFESERTVIFKNRKGNDIFDATSVSMTATQTIDFCNFD